MTARWVKALYLRAGLITLVYLLMSAAGARAYTGFLSGTPVGGTGAVIVGCGYLVAHFAFVVVAPILALAGALLQLFSRECSGR
jgi:hypothetical protein